MMDICSLKATSPPAHDPFRFFHLIRWLQILSLMFFSAHLRRERDSNPRYRFTRYTRSPGVRLSPLGHLSGSLNKDF